MIDCLLCLMSVVILVLLGLNICMLVCSGGLILVVMMLVCCWVSGFYMMM